MREQTSEWPQSSEQYQSPTNGRISRVAGALRIPGLDQATADEDNFWFQHITQEPFQHTRNKGTWIKTISIKWIILDISEGQRTTRAALKWINYSTAADDGIWKEAGWESSFFIKISITYLKNPKSKQIRQTMQGIPPVAATRHKSPVFILF